MKKVLLFILCLCLLCSGCASPDPSPAQPPTVSAQTAVLETAAGDGTLLLTRSFPEYSLSSADAQAAKRMEADLQDRIDTWMSYSADLPEYAAELYSAEKPWISWFVKLEGHTKRLDSKILSLYFEYSEFTGSAHPNTSTDSVTYNCNTGKVLELADILIDGFTPQSLASSVNDLLSKRTDELYDDYEALVGKAFSDGKIKWYLSVEGLCFHFSPYDIGPYSSGIITVTLPYSRLSEALRPQFLPR